MINLFAETTVSLLQACKLVPAARNGKKTHFSTLFRWVVDGFKTSSGEVVRLEAVRLGGRWMTSKEALQRFAERLTPVQGETQPLPRTPGKRRRASDHAARELEKHGI